MKFCCKPLTLCGISSVTNKTDTYSTTSFIVVSATTSAARCVQGSDYTISSVRFTYYSMPALSRVATS